MWRDARGSQARTKPNFFTTSCSSAHRIANCTLQFPEDRTHGRRQGILQEDPADDQEDHQDHRPQELRHRRHQGAGQVD